MQTISFRETKWLAENKSNYRVEFNKNNIFWPIPISYIIQGNIIMWHKQFSSNY